MYAGRRTTSRRTRRSVSSRARWRWSGTRRRRHDGMPSARRSRMTSACTSARWDCSASPCPSGSAARTLPCSTRCSSSRSWRRSAGRPRSRCSRRTPARRRSSTCWGPRRSSARYPAGRSSPATHDGRGISEPDAGSARDRHAHAGRHATATSSSSTAASGGSPTAARPTSTCSTAACRTQPGARGIGAVIVEADRPGVSFGAREKLMGFRGIPSADMIFDDVGSPRRTCSSVPAGSARCSRRSRSSAWATRR